MQIRKKKFCKKPLRWHDTTAIKGEASSRPCMPQSECGAGHTGCRIFSVPSPGGSQDTGGAEQALRENVLAAKGKGGKARIVPIEDDRITMMPQRLLEKTERGHKLLVPDGVPTDRAINGIQQFILRHRDAICDPTAQDRRITFHGLRHTYAAEKYTSLVNGGMTPLDAHFTVSRLLGHERLDVTNIYLASVKGGAARGE